MHHQKKRIIAAAVVLAAAVLLVFVPRPSKVSIVRSADGSAELRVPAGALPKGVAPEQLSVTRGETSPGEEGHLARYVLQPAGTAFRKPVELAVRLDVPEQPSANDALIPVPALYLLSDGGTSMENLPAALDFSGADGAVTATAELSHFSELNVLSFTSARIDNPADHAVGEQFFVGVRLTQDRTQIRVPIADDPDYVAYVHEMGEWYLQSGAFFSKTPATSPDEVRIEPAGITPGTGSIGRPRYTAVRAFTCAQPGQAAITYRVHSDGAFTHFTEDRAGNREAFDVPNEDLSAPVRITTRPFRCLGGDETVVAEPVTQLVDRTHVVVALRNASIDTVIRPSTLRMAVGDTLNVDVVLTDVTDARLADLAPASRPPFQTSWQATGVWEASPIFDRTTVEIEEFRRTPYLGRLTFRLPLKCIAPGKGTVRFDSYIGRSMEGDTAISAALPTYGGATVETPEIECTAAGTGVSQAQPARLSLEPVALAQTHEIGTSPCPQPMGTVRVDGPPGAPWEASDVPAWITMPPAGTTGQDVPVRFNCGISDYASHDEKAVITIRSGEQTATLDVTVKVKE